MSRLVSAIRTSPWHFRRWGIGFVLMVLWVAASLGWSWFLITRSFDRDIQSRITFRARQLATVSQDHVGAAAAAGVRQAISREMPRIDATIRDLAQYAYEQLLAAKAVNVDLQTIPELHSAVEAVRRHEQHVAYAMIWTDDGSVIAHSRRDLFRSNLDSRLWPALEPHQLSRTGWLNVPELSKDPRVFEATVPLKFNEKTLAYVSVAYPQAWLDEEFWASQGRVFQYAVALTIAGLAILYLGIHWSISRAERRRLEVQQTARARTSLLTERGMLASVLAHEVRSPLTALRFNLHSLRSLVAASAEGDTDRQLELADRCDREIRRLDGMLNDFLQRTQVIGPVESASVNTVIWEAIEFLRPALERKNIKVSVHLDPSNPSVHVHPDELRQVVLNLATNAHEAMPKGGTLAVSTVAEEPSEPAVGDNGGSRREPSVAILIRDSGVGIKPEFYERIFEPFFSTKPNGSGLGLALVRRVVSGAGGTVACESTVGKGTTFRIVLPRAQEGATEQAGGGGRGYAHVRRDEAALELDETPEIVIDQQDMEKKPEASSGKPDET